MTIDISNNDPRISYSVAQGVTQTSFAIPFEFFDDSDVNVYVDSVLKTITTDYTISGGGGSTGTVTISVTGATGGSVVVLTRDITIERTTDFTAGADINRAALNTQLDTLTAIAADVKDRAGLALSYNDRTVGVVTELPDVNDLKGRYLAFNLSTGAPEAGGTVQDVNALANISADIGLLADIQDGTIATGAITTVSGISSNVITVSNISSSVSTVAGISANVTTVAGISADVTAVAGDAADIGAVAANITSVNTVAGISADVTAVAGDVTNIGVVSSNIANVNTVAGISTDVTTVAGVAVDVGTVATDIADVSTVAGISADVTTVAGISTDVTTVAAVDTNVTIVAGISSNVTTVAGISSDVTTVAGISVNVTTVAGISADVTAVAGDAADIGTVATNIADVNTVAGISADVTTVAGISSDVTVVAANIADINTKVPRTSTTGAAVIPTGTEAQRDGTPLAGYFRFNSDVAKFEGYNGSAWGAVGGGATGGGSDEIFIENGQVVTSNYTIPADKNAMSTGPITINAGVTVTVSTGARYVVI